MPAGNRPIQISTAITLYNEVGVANSNNILFVAAAGNGTNNNDVNPTYPANFASPSCIFPGAGSCFSANVISVAMTDNRDVLSPTSNIGAQSVSLGAPGVNIFSTDLNNGYDYWHPVSPTGTGTSFATAEVSGSAALVLSFCSSLNTAQLKTRILNNVDANASLAGKTITGGRLNVYKAISAGAGATVNATYSDGTLSGTSGGMTLSNSVLTSISGVCGGGTITGSNLGSVVFNTGSLAGGDLQLGGTFAAGGALTIVGTGGSGSPTGNIFQGTFSIPSTWALETLANGTHNYTFAGAVNGTLGGTAGYGGVVNLTVNTGKGFFDGTSSIPSGTATITMSPMIAYLLPPQGPVGTSVTIGGANFGSTQGTSTVKFNGTPLTPASWSVNSITIHVPSEATVGNRSIVVTVAGVASNAASFAVVPHITSLSPTSGQVGTLVTITGTSFGATQGSSTVFFNQTQATPGSWSNGTIKAPVPAGATTGSVLVFVSGAASNAVTFSVQ